MRPNRIIAGRRRSYMTVGLLSVAVPVSAALILDGQALARTAGRVINSATASQEVSIHLQSHTIAYGEDVIANGSAPTSDAGRTVALEYKKPGTSGWSTVSSTSVGQKGKFHLRAPLTHSGQVEAAIGSSSSAPQPVTVTASFGLRKRDYNALGTGTVHVSGRLRPWLAGREVVLESSDSNGWSRVARSETTSEGRFDLHYTARHLGMHRLRVSFAGDQLNGATSSSAGSVTVYRQSVASWYNDGGGPTACGFTAHFGVANRDLPCGTKVAFYYHGATVTAVVDDRGPFVAGRDWDLNQNTASALGFTGVDSIWASA